MSDNPLIDVSHPVPFDKIESSHVVPAIRKLLEVSETQKQEIIQQQERNYENTLLAIDRLGEKLSHAWRVVNHIENVCYTEELHEAVELVRPEVTEFYSKLYLSDELWNALKSFAESSEGQELSGDKKRFLDKLVIEFKRHGTDLPADDKQRLIEIDKELSELSSQFKVNVLEGTKEFEFFTEEKEQLAGLPDIHLTAAKDAAAASGKENAYKLGLDAPSYVSGMTYLDDPALREMLYEARQKMAATPERNNGPIAQKTAVLRTEKAKLLGYSTYADFVTETRMAESGDKAIAFEKSIIELAKKQFDSENLELRDYKRKLSGEDTAELQPWDVAYYSEKLKKEKYDFDKELLRPYFRFEKVLDGLFDFAEKLFQLKFTEKTDLPIWHEDVKAYEIRDSSGNITSYCYIDLFPRSGEKRGGAWQLSLIPRVLGRKGQNEYVGLFTGNFTKPNSETPSLLSFDEVTTLFHEFGHFVHHLFTKVEIDFLGTVPWDFIELPSQLFENWCWEKDLLDNFAEHYETGEKIPEELLSKMQKAKNFRSASFIMRQLGFGLVDLSIHSKYNPDTDGDLADYARNIERDFSPTALPDYHSSIENFGHVFSGGYAAGYYSYMWASVLEAEAFSRFKKEGIFNQDVCKDLITHILEPGWSRDPLEMLNSYMGNPLDTPPDPKAFLVREGISLK